VTVARDVGIDLEEHRPIAAIEIARHFFAPSERAELEALPPTDQLVGFYRCWTRKEAFLKAPGEGLSFPLDAFEVRLSFVSVAR
jgi:4'-phosphopantetheinyl transferase